MICYIGDIIDFGNNSSLYFNTILKSNNETITEMYRSKNHSPYNKLNIITNNKIIFTDTGFRVVG